MRAMVTSAFRDTVLVRKAGWVTGTNAVAAVKARAKMVAVNFMLDRGGEKDMYYAKGRRE